MPEYTTPAPGKRPLGDEREGYILKIIEHFRKADCPVFEPSDVAGVILPGQTNRTYPDSHHGGYRLARTLLAVMVERGLVGRASFYGTNQSCYWLTERLK